MVAAPEYDLQVQAKLVPALCVLHNFICTHDPDDTGEFDGISGTHQRPTTHLSERAPADFGHTITPAE
ncbi:hypothetical protein M404DRAFT_153719 [Pisolithus tinctorius Marx 270]|uniref:DDE Tnp4 domain-containing protein n=1 Tax=Pisolithus tinctorius Marx 270 TaxID=870435 RepID=A0A0C3JRI2_PISTI|nr:hypothetical protein M404DRAFT_153719 [Pisolithus tinctorius Marx 270]